MTSRYKVSWLQKIKGTVRTISGAERNIDIVSVHDLFLVTASIICSSWIDQYSTTQDEEFMALVYLTSDSKSTDNYNGIFFPFSFCRVEFNSKFYEGQGYKFHPFSFGDLSEFSIED